MLSDCMQCIQQSPDLHTGDLPIVLTKLCGEQICSHVMFIVMVTKMNNLQFSEVKEENLIKLKKLKG